MALEPADIESWCEETLPELYDPGMFDLEEVSEDVWESVQVALEPLTDVMGEDEIEQVQDAVADWFRNHHDTVIDLIEPLDQAVITALCDKPQTAQHTADWYNQRRNRLTASEFSQILETPGKRAALLKQKLSTETGDRVGMSAPVGIAQPDGEMVATTWGHRFEPVTRDIYELELAGVGTVCDTLGRFTHPTIPWLSASPDGLVVKGSRAGRLIEIKSPKTRQPGDFVPSEYYVQMQIQMEVCNLDSVDFIEAQFVQRPIAAFMASTADQAAAEKATWKGRIEVHGHLEDTSTWRYTYSRPVEDLDDLDEAQEQSLPLLESSIWWLVKMYPRTVLRSPTWWATIGWPKAQLFWAEVLSLREEQEKEKEKQESQKLSQAESSDSDVGWLGS